MGSTQCQENTPTTCRLTPPGLQMGPSRLKIVRMPSSPRIGAQCLSAGWCCGAHRKPTPASSTHRTTLSNGTSILTPSADSTSEAPASDDTERLPCLAILTPAPAAISAAQVETL